jgi:O-glycosyl hydrolase
MTSPDAAVKPVAFLSPRKKPVLVLLNKDAAPRAATIANLPAGRYEYSHVGDGTISKMRTRQVDAGGEMKLHLPARSVLTITADPPAPGPEAG